MKVKEAMTNVDVAALAAELAPVLTGGRFEKAFQPAKDQVLMRFRRKGHGRLDLLFVLGKYATVVRRAPENPDQPSMVAKLLRRDLANGRVVGVSQVGFDRVMRFDIERGGGRRSLVLEIFGDGNLLLLDDADNILLPMRGMEHGVRRLKKGEVYQPPPGASQPLQLDVAGLQAAATDAKHDLVRFLAIDLGFGPQWAEELCRRADLVKNHAPADLDEAAWVALHDTIAGLARDIQRNDLAPQVIHHGDTPVDAVPFPLLGYQAERFVAADTTTFREALDSYFRGDTGEAEDDDPRRRRYDEAHGKLTRRLHQMESAIGGFHDEEAERRRDGDTLYGAFQAAEATIAALNAAREGRSWQEVEARIRAARDAGDPAAQGIRDIRPHDATAILRLQELDGTERDITVDLRLSVQDNADQHYTAAKKARSRAQGAGVALEEHRQKLRDLEAKGLDGFGAAPRADQGPTRHFWFENHRFTLTPNGFLAVGGRSAGGNDAVVKKYLRDGDRYVHASIHGAPSVVVRPADGSVAADVPEEDLRVACQFAACASRAWRQFGAASAYWVTPQQVNKTPRSGEFVPKGAWIVHGKRNTIDGLPMAWAIGRVHFTKGGVPVPAADVAAAQSDLVAKLVGGPPDGLGAFATDVLLLEPGDVEPGDAAVRLAEHFDVDVEAVQAALPPGPVRWSA